MTADSRDVFAVVFIIVFLMILIIGIISGVSLPAGLVRSVLAAVFFTGLLYVTVWLITRYALTGSGKQPEKRRQAAGSRLDVKVTDDYAKVPDIEITGNHVTEPVPGDFNPLTGKQIDPDVERVINNDPERMAQLVKKMGFDE
ncbi:MAG: hypothetical protein CVU89_12045 [Firmicutes bacterium HGW-Firmicutes-14]|nr:MAG: hypothetical protein CVU89_12045 [Firmicutes bacterium HGW-Firmicutes-14]